MSLLVSKLESSLRRKRAVDRHIDHEKYEVNVIFADRQAPPIR